MFWELPLNTDFLNADQQLILRPVVTGDEDLLYRIYASTRMDEMASVNWTEAQKEEFLQMQFNAQTIHYRNHYPNAEYQIIQCEDGLPAGRLIVDRSGGSILLMDIALLPEFRNAGIGTILLKELLAEAAHKSQPVILHVEAFNPALRLYKRLGFIKTGENGIYHEMVCTPGSDRA